MTDLETFRRQKDLFFKTSPDSPIPYGERASFGGLRYYPEQSDLRLVICPEEFPDKATIWMLTSTGDEQEYLRWGEFRFTVDSRPARLTIYYAMWGDYFVPFADATSGSETYGAGRYLELEDLGDGSFVADFNLAYNPYCAYNEEYSCPIPPAENRLDLPIRAGELVYHTDS